MRTQGLTVAILLFLVTLGQADPLDPSAVSGDAKWVVHLDVDALRSSIVVQNACQEFVDKCPIAEVALPMLAGSRALIGMDPTEDLFGMTLYGSRIGKEQGVLIVFADANQDLLAEKVQGARDYESSSYGSHELHSWTHRDRRGERPVTGAFYKDKAMVFSGSQAEVKAALDVLDGKKPGLTCDVLAAEVPAGTTVVARAVGIAKVPGAPKLAKEIDSVSIVNGENDGESFLQVKVVAESPHVAEQMGSVAEGIRALGVLHAINSPQDKELVEGIKVNVADKTVTVDSSAPAEIVWQHLQASVKKAIKRHRKMIQRHVGMIE